MPSADSYVPGRQIEYLKGKRWITHRDIFNLIANMATSNVVGGYWYESGLQTRYSDTDELIGAVMRYDHPDPANKVVETVFMSSNPYDSVIDLEMRAYRSGIRVFRSADGDRPATVRSSFTQAQKRQFIDYIKASMFLPFELHSDQILREKAHLVKLEEHSVKISMN